MDSLIRKACELGEKTAHCNVEVILNATHGWKKSTATFPPAKLRR